MKFRTKALGLALLCALSQNAFSEQLDVWIRASNDSKVIYQKLADQFQKETGISIKYFNAVTDFDQRLARAATGNALPDVVFNDAIIVGQMVQLGIVDEIKPSELKGGGDIYDAAWKSAQQPDGKYYGVPTSAHTYALFIRQDWLNKLNLKAPSNWDELKKVAQAFTHDDPDGNGKNDTYGFTMPLATTRGYASSFSSSYLWQAGANYLVANQPGKFKAALDSKEMVTAMEFMRGMVCEGLAQPGAINHTTADANTAFRSGQTGMYSSGPYHIALFDKDPGKETYTVVPPPAGPGGAISMAEGTTAFLMKTSQRKAAAKKFLEFLISPEGQKIGMATDSTSMPIVRLPVNKTLNIKDYHDDPRWEVFADTYAKNGRYMPQIPNWIPVRQITADGFNKIYASCDGDIPAMLKEINGKVNAELKRQNAWAE